jgi:hypothetical protein
MASIGVLFGLNYDYLPDAKLFGCVNDVKNMNSFLTKAGMKCETYTDDNPKTRPFTTAKGIADSLQNLANETRKKHIRVVWIHFSGHGTRTMDRDRDEKDGMDECLVPSDVKTAGVITDDMINNILAQFNPNTRVICVFDCCHSGTMCDLAFSWESPKNFQVENSSKIKGKIISISGCLDTQYSADTWDSKRRMATGAMTSELLNCLETGGYFSLNSRLRKNTFDLVVELRQRLRKNGYDQVPKLASSFNLANEAFMV